MHIGVGSLARWRRVYGIRANGSVLLVFILLLRTTYRRQGTWAPITRFICFQFLIPSFIPEDLYCSIFELSVIQQQNCQASKVPMTKSITRTPLKCIRAGCIVA